MVDLEQVEYMIIDFSVRESLKDILGDDDHAEIESEFFDDAEKKVVVLLRHDPSSLGEIGSISHTLASASGNLGFSAFSHACRIVDEAVRNDEVSELDEKIKDIAAQFDRLQYEFHQLGS